MVKDDPMPFTTEQLSRKKEQWVFEGINDEHLEWKDRMREQRDRERIMSSFFWEIADVIYIKYEWAPEDLLFS